MSAAKMVKFKANAAKCRNLVGAVGSNLAKCRIQRNSADCAVVVSPLLSEPELRLPPDCPLVLTRDLMVFSVRAKSFERPCHMCVDVHCRPNVGVSQKFLLNLHVGPASV